MWELWTLDRILTVGLDRTVCGCWLWDVAVGSWLLAVAVAVAADCWLQLLAVPVVAGCAYGCWLCVLAAAAGCSYWLWLLAAGCCWLWL